jgi:orotate phosphoribosyltransferase
MKSSSKAGPLSTLPSEIFECCHLQSEAGFTLRSGQISKEYFDTYQLLNNPPLLKKIIKAMTALVPLDKIDCLGGIEMAGVPFAALLSHSTDLPFRIIRQKAKNYGTNKQVEGGPIKGQRMMLIENVISTGGAVLECYDALQKEGAVIKHVLCLVDRRSPEIRKNWNKKLRVLSLIKT